MAAVSFPDPCVVIAEAERWIGTPYRKHARLRGQGCDCLGFVIGVWEAVTSGTVPPFAYALRHTGKDQEATLRKILTPVLFPVSKIREGDVVLLRFRREARGQHFGILAGSGSVLLHCVEGRGVVASRYAPWRGNTTAIYRFIRG